MVSSLVESDLCRAGIIALLKDIINGNMSDRSRQLLLASRLVALNKPRGGYRPITVGELFYRLAGIIVVRKIVKAAATLLAPHQYGVGVSGGAERILQTLCNIPSLTAPLHWLYSRLTSRMLSTHVIGLACYVSYTPHHS